MHLSLPSRRLPAMTVERKEQWSNWTLTGALAVVSLLFVSEVRRTWRLRQQVVWDDRYLAAVRSDSEHWAIGWRLEELEQRLKTQKAWLETDVQLVDAAFAGASRHYWRLGHSGALEDPAVAAETAAMQAAAAQAVHRTVEDADAVVQLACLARPDYWVRVGPDDWRNAASDRCGAFSGLRRGTRNTKGGVGPHAMWELVPLDGGAVGLRALSNGYFLRAAAPTADGSGGGPWRVEAISPLPGIAERFQLRRGDDENGGAMLGTAGGGGGGVMIWSELMRGYLSCAGGATSEALKGFPGTMVLDDATAFNFNFTAAPPVSVRRARALREASRAITATQAKAAAAEEPRLHAKADRAAAEAARSAFEVHLLVPMTSKGTDMSSVAQSPIWFNMFASFMESIDWKANRHTYVVHLGFDQGDPLYDTGDAWAELRTAFAANAQRALKWLGHGNATARKVLGPTPGGTDTSGMLRLKLHDFEGLVGAPSQVVTKMALKAYDDGADYLYQLNDDTILVSKGWAETMIADLAGSMVAPNVGVAGPLDTNNERILTHAFVHRTHVDIFGAFFPPAFKNWWSDDWISAVYGAEATFAHRDVMITHNVQSQKTGAFNRYDVDHAAQYHLQDEVKKGFVQINKFAAGRGFRGLRLPEICGYAPGLAGIYDALVPGMV